MAPITLHNITCMAIDTEEGRTAGNQLANSLPNAEDADSTNK